jgi:hypothetical protein
MVNSQFSVSTTISSSCDKIKNVAYTTDLLTNLIANGNLVLEERVVTT